MSDLKRYFATMRNPVMKESRNIPSPVLLHKIIMLKAKAQTSPKADNYANQLVTMSFIYKKPSAILNKYKKTLNSIVDEKLDDLHGVTAWKVVISVFFNHVVGVQLEENDAIMRNLFSEYELGEFSASSEEERLLQDTRLVKMSHYLYKLFVSFGLSSNFLRSTEFSSPGNVPFEESPNLQIQEVVNPAFLPLLSQRECEKFRSGNTWLVVRRIIMGIVFPAAGIRLNLNTNILRCLYEQQGYSNQTIVMTVVMILAKMPDQSLQKCIQHMDNYFLFSLIRTSDLAHYSKHYREHYIRVLYFFMLDLPSRQNLEFLALCKSFQLKNMQECKFPGVYFMLIRGTAFLKQPKSTLLMCIPFLLNVLQPKMIAYLIYCSYSEMMDVTLVELFSVFETMLSSIALKFHAMQRVNTMQPLDVMFVQAFTIIKCCHLYQIIYDLYDNQWFSLSKTDLGLVGTNAEFRDCWQSVEATSRNFFWISLICKHVQVMGSEELKVDDAVNKKVKLDDETAANETDSLIAQISGGSIFETDFIIPYVDYFATCNYYNPLAVVREKYNPPRSRAELDKFVDEFIHAVQLLPCPTGGPLMGELVVGNYPTADEKCRPFSIVMIKWLLSTADRTLRYAPTPPLALAFECTIGQVVYMARTKYCPDMYPFSTFLDFIREDCMFEELIIPEHQSDLFQMLNAVTIVASDDAQLEFCKGDGLLVTTLQYIIIELLSRLSWNNYDSQPLSKLHPLGRMLEDLIRIGLQSQTSTVHALVFFFEWFMRQSVGSGWSNAELLTSLFSAFNNKNSVVLYLRFIAAYSPVVMDEAHLRHANSHIWWIYTHYFCNYMLTDALCNNEDVNCFVPDDTTCKLKLVEAFLRVSSLNAIIVALETIKSFTTNALRSNYAKSVPWLESRNQMVDRLNTEYKCHWFFSCWLRPLAELCNFDQDSKAVLQFIWHDQAWCRYLCLDRASRMIEKAIEGIDSASQQAFFMLTNIVSDVS